VRFNSHCVTFNFVAPDTNHSFFEQCAKYYPLVLSTQCGKINSVPVGTSVYMIKQPIKVGWLDDTLYIEAHPDLEGGETTLDQKSELAMKLIQKANN
jgi:L,D-transpeptidase ErfK/SrfK